MLDRCVCVCVCIIYILKLYLPILYLPGLFNQVKLSEIKNLFTEVIWPRTSATFHKNTKHCVRNN